MGGVSAAMLLNMLSPKFAEAQQIAPADARLKAEYLEYPSPQGNEKTSGYLVRPAGAAGPLPDDKPVAGATRGSGRTAVFVKDNCVACGQLVQRLQSSGAEFDLYMVGSRQDDARIRDWAKRANVDPARVRSGSITLNHDGGRWLTLGVPGDLPAVVREVNGQRQRQP